MLAMAFCNFDIDFLQLVILLSSSVSHVRLKLLLRLLSNLVGFGEIGISFLPRFLVFKVAHSIDICPLLNAVAVWFKWYAIVTAERLEFGLVEISEMGCFVLVAVLRVVGPVSIVDSR